MRDPYSMLGVARDANETEIKKAYHGLAKELHPDLNPDDPVVADRFKEVSAAYSMLGDPAMRTRYDNGEIGADGQEKARRRYEYAGGRGGPGAGPGGYSADDIFGGFFSNMRGGRARQAAPQKGPDRAYKITADFLDAANGSTRRITLPDGKMLDIRIPAGIVDGKQIRLRGQGDPGPAGPGDGLVEVNVRAHPQFRREGTDIHMDLPLALADAVLGAKVEVPTINGPVTMTIPKGANNGQTLRLKAKGIKPPKAEQAGNQYIHLRLTLPDPPDPDLTALLEEWARKQFKAVDGQPDSQATDTE